MSQVFMLRSQSSRHRFRVVSLAIYVAISVSGCQSAMSQPSDRPATVPHPAEDGSITNAATDWPLKFRAHYFDAFNYSTYACRVRYGRYLMDEPDNELHISSASLGDRYPNNMRAGWGPIPNFPPLAVVNWRSADGSVHHAEVDIGEIFKDQLIRHNVPREEVNIKATNNHLPGIILEVNDRTINVYMRMHVATMALQIPGNKYSGFRDDLIKVYSRAY